MTGTLPVSGAISVSAIQAAFGLSGALGLNALYRGGSIVPNGPAQNAAVPTSGAISFGNLYGATDVAAPAGYSFSATISANTLNYDVATAASAAGWNGTEALFASITINAGVVVGSSSTGAYAFTIPSLPANSTVLLICNGTIVGMGGAGGTGGTANYGQTTNLGLTGGASGGPGLLCQFPTTLQGAGVIGGGGGGGGGGQGWYGLQTVKIGNVVNTYYYANGGGGGGAGAGSNVGAVGAGGAYGRGTLSGSVDFSGSNGGPGGAASTTGGGAGGAAGTTGGGTAVNGAAGGAIGAAGAAATDGGGPAGLAINGNGNISFQWSGSVRGSVA
jgi:hypothetical protein